jgi:hypothetical protein
MDKRGEQLRENMHKAIEKYSDMTCKEVVQASQRLDRYMNKYCSYKNN